MAKTIKAIVCPKCGSNNKTAVKSDYYICASCKTEYYLDSDDVTIIHRNDNPTQAQPLLKPAQAALIFGIVFLAIIGIFMFATLGGSSTSNTGITSDKEIPLDDEQMLLCINSMGELLYVTAGLESTGNYENRNEKLVVYFDNFKGENIKKQELNLSIPKNKSHAPVREVYFSNGDTYIIFNEKILFIVDPNALEIRELGQQFFKAPEFASGLAKLEAYYKNDSFKIHTSNGMSYVYHPISDSIYDGESYHALREEIPEGAINTTQFKFIGDTFGAKALVKFELKMKSGYPYQDLYMDMIDNEPKVRRYPDNFVSFENFFPERRFFNPKLLGYNDKILMLSFTVDANSQSSDQVQAIDIETRDIKWTFDCGPLDKHVKYSPYRTLSNNEFTIMTSNFGAITFDNKTGEVVASFDKR